MPTDTAQTSPVPGPYGDDSPRPAFERRPAWAAGSRRTRWRDGIPAAFAVLVLHAVAGVAALRGLGVVEPEPVITPPAITGVLVAEASRKLAEAPPAPTPPPAPPPREMPKADPEVVPPPPPPPPKPEPEPAPPPPPKPEPKPEPKPKPRPRPKPERAPPVKAPPTERSVTVPEEPPVAQEPAPAPAPPQPAPPPVAAAPSPAPPAPAPAPTPAPPVAPPISDAAHLNNPAPVYPTRSRRLGEEGRVVLEVLILPNGRVGEIKVKQTSGYAALDEAALEAVRRWKFVPAKRGDEPIPYRYELPVIFSLRS